MSLSASRWAWDLPVSPTAKLLLLAIADCCQGSIDNQRCWPSIARLSGMTGLSERAVRNQLRDLEARRLIRTELGRGRRTSTYRLAIADQWDQKRTVGDTYEASNSAEGEGRKVAGSDIERGIWCPSEGHDVPLRGASGAPQRGIWCPQNDNRTGKERGKRERESAGPEPTGLKTLSHDPVADWQDVAAELRPDIDAKTCWEKFALFYANQELTQERWGELWRLWCLREWNNPKERTTITPSNRSPGDFLHDGQASDLSAEYEVCHGP